jgi:hypothetical protein
MVVGQNITYWDVLFIKILKNMALDGILATIACSTLLNDIEKVRPFMIQFCL